jgi:hypothetical protein
LNLDSPAVNLSVSTVNGSETGPTVITVTATASSAVAGPQTVSLAVAGTGITAGDYNLSGTTITIASGATTGTVTFTVVDDTVLEGAEVAALTISNASAGIKLGTTLTQNITIADNEVAPPAPAPAPVAATPPPASPEDNAPPLVLSVTSPGIRGDGNGDGIADSLQGNVQSSPIKAPGAPQTRAAL